MNIRYIIIAMAVITTALAAPDPSGKGSALADQKATGMSFDRTAWVAAAQADEYADDRFDMIPAALATLHQGMTQPEVIAQLGDPDQRFVSSWVYYAGSTLFGGEFVALLVKFDEAGRMTDADKVNSESWQ